MTSMTRDGDHVVKTMPRPGGDPYFARAAAAGLPAVLRYADALRDAGVPLPPDLTVTSGPHGPEVRHTWIRGPVLTEIPAGRAASLAASAEAIAGWIRALAATGARLDANLANFVLPDGGTLVCVDILPPLLVPLRPPEPGPWEQLIGGLCYDTDIALCALAGYAARHLLLTAPGPGSPGLAAGLLRLCPGHPRPRSLAARWFHSRLRAAGRAATGQMTAAQLGGLLAATSARALQAAPPGARADRAGSALSMIETAVGEAPQ